MYNTGVYLTLYDGLPDRPLHPHSPVAQGVGSEGVGLTWGQELSSLMLDLEYIHSGHLHSLKIDRGGGG